MRFITLLTIVGSCTGLVSKAYSQQADVIPQPINIVPANGSFVLTGKTPIIISKGNFRNEADQFNQLVSKSFGKKLPIITKGAGGIFLTYKRSVNSAEGYELTISPAKISIEASTATGIFHGIETLRQLLPAGIETGQRFREIPMPALHIVDVPAYKWRGMHLDLSRHFFSIAYLRKFVDMMALYKMNKLHLHLTDDQGWRIEIKKYPKLTEQGAWRTFDKNDSACIRRSKDNPDFALDPSHIIHKNGKTLYGGFYTQKQMKDFVAYAANKHVEIIPEVDMPGHMMAAINSYPFLTCNGENKWGELFTKPICPCNENTFTFAENVFKEIMDVFPSKYIHIGGDEVDRSDWARSPACKALMEKQGIKDLPGLQSYFIDRMEKYFNAHGRKMIGWDEIIEGGISPSAIVMYWRGWVPSAPVKAVRNGNQVIMAPGEPLYFDNLPDQYSISKVYHFNPVPAALTPSEAKYIIGAQAELWSENIPSENRADYMAMPRMTALAEMLWTNRINDYESYIHRLNAQYARLDALHIHYRLPDLPGMITQNVFTESDTLAIKKPLPQMRIFYTTDGSLPTISANELLKPLIIDRSEHIRLAVFMPNGLRGDIYDLNYTKEPYANAKEQSGLQQGLECSYYKAYFKATKYLSGVNADSVFISSTVTVPKSINAPSFAIKYKGYINVPFDGVYSFYLTCDDGGVLQIGDKTVVDNDGLHSAIEKNGQVALRKGMHPFLLNFIEGGGGYTLKLKYSIGHSVPADVPANWFSH